LPRCWLRYYFCGARNYRHTPLWPVRPTSFPVVSVPRASFVCTPGPACFSPRDFPTCTGLPELSASRRASQRGVRRDTLALGFKLFVVRPGRFPLFFHERSGFLCKSRFFPFPWYSCGRAFTITENRVSLVSLLVAVGSSSFSVFPVTTLFPWHKDPNPKTPPPHGFWGVLLGFFFSKHRLRSSRCPQAKFLFVCSPFKGEFI